MKDVKRPKCKKEDTRKAGVECSTVIFVPNTKSGTLVRKLREREEVMKELTGFGIKFQEAGGSQLGNSFSLELGKGKHCGRVCPPCTMNGEKRENCRKRNILYETVCKICNPETKRVEKDVTIREGVYIGESSRSLHERSLEHIKDAMSFSKKSHIVKHWMSFHPEHPTPPPFSFKVTQQFKDCMSRQVAEAIRIQHTKDNILNSKCEYLQNCITRLTVNEESWERKSFFTCL